MFLYFYIIFRAIEEESKRQHKPGFDILIDEWGTSGRQRPTIHDLIQLLIKVEIYQAADYLNKEILNRGPVSRPEDGPGAPVSTLSDEIAQVTRTLHQLPETVNEEQNRKFDPSFNEFNTTLPHLLYTELEYITDNFNLTPVAQNGRKLGAGAFGTVFLGEFPKCAPPEDVRAGQIFQKMKLPLRSRVAVKRLDPQKVSFVFNIPLLTIYVTATNFFSMQDLIVVPLIAYFDAKLK